MKNTQFQKTAVRCKDGNMLHLLSRQEIDISNLELDERHLKNMLEKGYVVLRGGGNKSTKRSESSDAPKTDKIEADDTDAVRSKSTSKRK